MRNTDCSAGANERGKTVKEAMDLGKLFEFVLVELMTISCGWRGKERPVRRVGFR
jgi:hypothetical protein